MSIIMKFFYYNTCRLIRPAQDECIDDVTEVTNMLPERKIKKLEQELEAIEKVLGIIKNCKL